MFCPQCGSTQSDELKYCKSCGANLQALRQLMATRETDENTDGAELLIGWSETGPAVYLTPEMKRLREIKAGVITGSIGVALMILLFVLMNGIVATGRVSDAAAEILMRLWIVGILPLLVGAALIFNGTFVSKLAGSTARGVDPDPNVIGRHEPDAFLPPADTNELFPAGFSVTDETTKHLKQPVNRKD